MLTMILVRRGTDLAQSALRGETNRNAAHANKPRVTRAAFALWIGAAEARIRPLLLQLSQKEGGGLKMPPTTLRARITMVTSSCTAPISSICLS